MDKNNFLTIDFDKIPSIYDVHYIGDEFLMFDNLYSDPIIEKGDNMFLSHPIKAKNCIVFCCFKGFLKIKINLTEYCMEANDTLTALSGSIMEIIGASEDVRISVISFSDKYFTPLEHIEEFMNIGNMIYNNPIIHLSDDVMQDYINIYTKMKSKLLQEENPFIKFTLKAYSYVLCGMALEQFAHKPVEKISNSSRPIDLYNKFIKLLQKDFRQQHAIKYYAQKLNISPKYFSSLIKKVSRKNAKEWIDEYLLLEAKALLKSRQFTIQQISDSLSFPNQSFFAKYFKAHTGLTPSQYQSTPD